MVGYDIVFFGLVVGKDLVVVYGCVVVVELVEICKLCVGFGD